MRHSQQSLNRITLLLSAFFIFISLAAPEFADSIALWIVLISVLAIGIPHGAIDHMMAAELYGLNQTLKDHLVFYSSYLLIMLIIGALWVYFPAAGMAFFLIISIYHFGQADMEDFITERRYYSRILYVNRGLMIIGFILFAAPSVTYPIVADAIRISSSELSAFMPDATSALWSIALLYILISAGGIFTGQIQKKISYCIDSVVLGAVLLITGPLIGFALYFALWHSAGHVNEMRAFFEQKNSSLTLVQFYKKALPFTLVSLAGLAFLLWLNRFFMLENQFLTLMFILISVLTLPHMLIVERMYNSKTENNPG